MTACNDCLTACNERVNLEIEQAEQSYELSKAAELKYSRLPGLQAALAAEAEAEAARQAEGGSLVKTIVSEDDVAAVVSEWTGARRC